MGCELCWGTELQVLPSVPGRMPNAFSARV